MKTFACLLAALALAITPRGHAAAPAPAKVEFNRDIRPIMSDTCFKCHGFDPKARKGGLRLDVGEAAHQPAESGARPIVPGQPEESEVVARLFTEDVEDRMPPKKSHLVVTPEQRALIRRWIAEGAEYQPHWALVPPRSNGAASIDEIVRTRLAGEGLAPSPEADPATLRRRVSLALTGLPPDAVTETAETYEQTVDRLLALAPLWRADGARMARRRPLTRTRTAFTTTTSARPGRGAIG